MVDTPKMIQNVFRHVIRKIGKHDISPRTGESLEVVLAVQGKLMTYLEEGGDLFRVGASGIFTHSELATIQSVFAEIHGVGPRGLKFEGFDLGDTSRFSHYLLNILNEKPDLPKHVEAVLEFISTEEGGKSIPAKSNYRPLIHYDGENWEVVVDFPDLEEVYPGDTARAYLTFLSPVHHTEKMIEGKSFELREGQSLVAEGTVIQVLDL